MIKMLVLDIDGTIIKKDFTYSKELKDTLLRLQDNGVKVVIATGRMHHGAVPLIKELGLNTPAVSYQGGMVRNWQENDDILYSKRMTAEQAKRVIEYFRSQNVHINAYSCDKLFVEQDDDLIKEYVTNRYVQYNVLDNLETLDLSKLDKLLCIENNPQKMQKVVDDLTAMFKGELFIVKSMHHYCEVTHPEATKGKAIEFLCKYWNIDISETMAIGDNDNDIDMIKTAHIGVAMGNGTPNLKAAADFVTKSVEDDGVVFAVEKFIGVNIKDV